MLETGFWSNGREWPVTGFLPESGRWIGERVAIGWPWTALLESTMIATAKTAQFSGMR